MNYLFIILAIVGLAKAKTPAEQALKHAEEAKEMFAQAQYGAGIILLEKAHKLDSTNINYQCDIAYGYINVREYANAEKILKKLQYKNNASDRVYVMLARLYKAQADIKKAEEFIEKGLRFFNKSGPLYLELGALKYYLKETDQAVELWHKGITNDPNFSSNYYWLAKHYNETGERLWAVLYGEIFAALEQNTYRSKDMGHMLFNIYKEAFEYTDESPDGINFLPYEPAEGEFSIPFPRRFLQTMKMAREVTSLGSSDVEVFYGISDIRFDFIEYWHEQQLNEKYPFKYFDFLSELYSLGFWDAYHVWLLIRWNEEEFKYWYKNHKKTYEDFLVWFSTSTPEPDSQSTIFETISK